MPWPLRGLRNGVVTTGYPRRPDPYAETFPATVQPIADLPVDVSVDMSLCPTGAIDSSGGLLRIDTGQCIRCGRCVRERPDLFSWAPGVQTARLHREALVVPQLPETDEAVEQVRHRLAARTGMLRRSVHVRHVDAGSDGSEEWEVLALLNPVYDVHRLGIFFTASPRHADVLLVTGAGSHGMAEPLRRTVEATPRPLVVIAAGTDAISGGLVAPDNAPHYATAGGLGELIDVDVWVPGSPPSPFSLLHALLLAVGRISPEGR
ncbi:MAG TPA: NADH:ubiquinone oxidoreductase [Pseudonocardiaceae bacterium]|jgi:Ni,Fe-hydrogenase III small subunit/ferredoxin|nr:NADH:ubiquinone oxidoreductase [Pseudonocardiaceae bacterium]